MHLIDEARISHLKLCPTTLGHIYLEIAAVDCALCGVDAFERCRNIPLEKLVGEHNFNLQAS
jgi:hypothetical protein